MKNYEGKTSKMCYHHVKRVELNYFSDLSFKRVYICNVNLMNNINNMK